MVLRFCGAKVTKVLEFVAFYAKFFSILCAFVATVTAVCVFWNLYIRLLQLSFTGEVEAYVFDCDASVKPHLLVVSADVQVWV